MGQLLVVTHAECNPEIFGPIRFDSLIQKITFSKVLENVLWCLEIPDPTLPSTLKVTQFLIRDRSVKIYDDFLVQMKASVVDCQFSPNEEKLLFGCSDNSLVILGPGDKFFYCVSITNSDSKGKNFVIDVEIQQQSQLNAFLYLYVHQFLLGILKIIYLLFQVARVKCLYLM